jgi:hypothetical protein
MPTPKKNAAMTGFDRSFFIGGPSSGQDQGREPSRTGLLGHRPTSECIAQQLPSNLMKPTHGDNKRTAIWRHLRCPIRSSCSLQIDADETLKNFSMDDPHAGDMISGLA